MIMPILAVQSVDASLDFYVNKLGFKQEMVMAGPDGKNFFGFVSLGKAMIGVDSSMPDAARGGAGVDLMVYLPDEVDIDRHYADVQGRGTAIEAPLETKYWGDRVYTVLDPDGYRITVSKTVKQVPMEEIESITGTKIT